MLTKQQIKDIPKLRESVTNVEIAKLYGVHVQAIIYWINKLKKAGIDVSPAKKGRPAINLND